MSRTYNHIIEAKFRNNILVLAEIPLNIRLKWDRHNFEVGYFRNERNKKRYALKKHDILNEIAEDEQIRQELWERFIDFCDGCSNDCQSCFYFHSA